MKILFRDTNVRVIRALQVQFAGVDDVSCEARPIFDEPADAIVSPANSFGFMDGGIDALYSDRWPDIQQTVQTEIKRAYQGELLVGQALVASTHETDFPWLVCAPTMRVPSTINDTIAIRLAIRAALRLARGFKFRSVAIPGLGTGCGTVPPELAAAQMRAGYDDVFNAKPFPESWVEAWEDQKPRLIFEQAEAPAPRRDLADGQART